MSSKLRLELSYNSNLAEASITKKRFSFNIFKFRIFINHYYSGVLARIARNTPIRNKCQKSLHFQHY